MWNSRPPLHGKKHLKFPFWLFANLPHISYKRITSNVFKASYASYPSDANNTSNPNNASNASNESNASNTIYEINASNESNASKPSNANMFSASVSRLSIYFFRTNIALNSLKGWLCINIIVAY